MGSRKAQADHKTPARDRLTGVAISREELREALIAALDDPAFARAVASRLLLPTFPVQGGVCTSPTTISSGNFGETCGSGGGQDNGNYNFGGTGKVGIGTTSPGYYLDVTGSSPTTARFTNTSSGTAAAAEVLINNNAGNGITNIVYGSGYSYGSVFNVGANGSAVIARGGPLGIGTDNGNTNPLYLGVNSSTKMTLLNSGNVGIGTTGPLSKLDVNGGVAIGSYAGANAAPSNGLIVSGKVGVGTATPQQDLTVGAGKTLATEMATPGAPSLTAGTSGSGTLIAGTYYYKITALDANGGQTLGGAEASVSVPANGSVTVSWTALPGASQYRVWRGTSAGGENTYNVASGTSYLDTGGGTSGTIPTTNTASGLELTAGGVSWFPYQLCAPPGGGFGLLDPGYSSPSTVLYQGGTDNTTLRTYDVGQAPAATLLKVWAPPEASDGHGGQIFPTSGREATLTLQRATDNEVNSEFVDLYNNYYPDANPASKQYGLRIQERGTGIYRDFVFDQYDGNEDPVTKLRVTLPVMALKADRTVTMQSHADTNSWTETAAVHATAAVKTTDSTATTLATIALDTPRAYQILVRVVARQPGATPHYALFFRTALAYNEGGTAAVVAQSDVISPLGGTGWTCTLLASGADILVRVTGAASATVYWVATIEYQSVSTDS